MIKRKIKYEKKEKKKGFEYSLKGCKEVVDELIKEEFAVEEGNLIFIK